MILALETVGADMDARERSNAYIGNQIVLLQNAKHRRFSWSKIEQFKKVIKDDDIKCYTVSPFEI